jgi:hypothetical protein
MTRGLPEVNRNLEAWLLKTEASLYMVCEVASKQLEQYAKQNRPWTDRTANARQGLFGSTGRYGTMFRIFISHQVDYGVWLELANQGKYAILEQTVNANVKEIYAAWKKVAQGAV